MRTSTSIHLADRNFDDLDNAGRKREVEIKVRENGELSDSFASTVTISRGDVVMEIVVFHDRAINTVVLPDGR